MRLPAAITVERHTFMLWWGRLLQTRDSAFDSVSSDSERWLRGVRAKYNGLDVGSRGGSDNASFFFLHFFAYWLILMLMQSCTCCWVLLGYVALLGGCGF